MRIPLSVTVISILLALVGLFATWAGYTDISPIIAGFSHAEPTADAAAAMIGARSLAMAVVLVLGLLWRDARVLLAGFVMAILRESQDLWISLARPDLPRPFAMIGAFAAIIAAEAYCIYTLSRAQRTAA